jgi:NAD(P)-dependent dehydrogenase (short-subunit alcohol dehydrogenase family)
MTQTGRLQGRTCLIVGGTSGIGLATARRFLAEGALVAVCGRSQKTAAEAWAILGEINGERVLAVAADAADPAQVEDLCRQALVFFSGRIDILYHVAGISGGGSATPRCTNARSRAGTRFSMPTRGACF